MFRNRCLAALLLILTFLFNGFGQSDQIDGSVIDPAGSAVAGATIVLRNTRTGLERLASSDANGRFAFTGLGNGTFEIVSFANGFGRTTLGSVERGSTIEIKLEPAGVREEVTVVSGSRQEELRESLNAKVDVLTRSDIVNSGSQTVGEALREMPGIFTRRGSETSGVAGEQIQGIDSRQVLVLLDGQPVTGARGIKSGIINLDRQSTDRLESIEVVKGAVSSLYGSDAIGGVINMRLREPSNPFAASISTATGSRGAFDGKAGIGFIKRRLSGIFSFERHKNNGFDFVPATFQQEGAGFGRYDAFGRLKFRFSERLSLTGFSTSYWNKSRGRVIGESGPQFNDVNDESQNYGLTADWAFDGRTFFQARGYFSRFDEISRGRLYPSNAALQDGNLFERFGKLDANVSRLFGERHFVQAGVEFTTNRYSGTNRLQRDRASADIRTVWAQDKISLFDRISLTLGARFDDHSVFGAAISPKVGASFRLADWWSVRGSWGKGFRAPDLGQLYYRLTNTVNFYQVIGNPNLSPETSGSWQFGTEVTAFDRNARIGLNVFRNDVKNLINNRNLGMVTIGNVNTLFARYGIDPSLREFITYNVLLFYYQNLANVFTQGIEVDGAYRLPKGFNVAGAYTFLEAYDKATNRFLVGRHKHQSFVKLGYENARLGLIANFRGTFYGGWINTRNETTGATVLGKGFELWDLYGSKKVWSGFTLFGSIDNLFNNVDPNRGTSAQQRIEVGRTYRAGIRWSYDRGR